PRGRPLERGAPEARHADGAGQPPGPAGAGRAGGGPRPAGAAALPAAAAGDRGRPQPGGDLFLAHRVRPRARGQPHLDPARRRPTVGRRHRRAEAVGEAPAHHRPSPAAFGHRRAPPAVDAPRRRRNHRHGHGARPGGFAGATARTTPRRPRGNRGPGPRGHLPGDPLMKAALRMALAYFSIVPLQRWLNLAALLLFVAAVITGSRAGSLAARSMAMGMTIFATLLAVMVPALMGGVAM